jgi:hypothetical protein
MGTTLAASITVPPPAQAARTASAQTAGPVIDNGDVQSTTSNTSTRG